MGSLRRTRPENLDDLTIQVAIVRPGPIQGGAVNPYIERRQRLREDPALRGPLRPSLARACAARHARDDHLPGPGHRGRDGLLGLLAGRGRGPAPGDEPQALGGGDRGLTTERFVEGAMADWPDVDEALAERVWSMVDGFSGFGFPKAHGAAFGLLAYQSTWLRVHYGARVPVRAARRAADGLLPARRAGPRGPAAGDRGARARRQRQRGRVHVVDAPAAVVPLRLRNGRRRARACGPSERRRARAPAGRGRRAARSRSARARLRPRRARRRGRGARRRARGRGPVPDARGPRRARGSRAPPLAQLAWSGACDGLAARRRDAPLAPGRRRAAARGVASRATQLALPLELPEAPALRALDDWDAMIADYATTGLTVDRHPLRLLRRGLQRARAWSPAPTSTRLAHGAAVTIGGLVVARQRPGTAKGVCFLLLEDELGTVNLIVPPKVYERDRLVVRTEPLVVAEGMLERFASAGGAINVLVAQARGPRRRRSARPAPRGAGQGLLAARRPRAGAASRPTAARRGGRGRRRDRGPRARAECRAPGGGGRSGAAAGAPGTSPGTRIGHGGSADPDGPAACGRRG